MSPNVKKVISPLKTDVSVNVPKESTPQEIILVVLPNVVKVSTSTLSRTDV